MQERKNTLNEGSMNGGIQERRKIGKEGDKNREMQKKGYKKVWFQEMREMRNSGKEGYRKGRILVHEMRDHRKEKERKKGRQEKGDTRK